MAKSNRNKRSNFGGALKITAPVAHYAAPVASSGLSAAARLLQQTPHAAAAPMSPTQSVVVMQPQSAALSPYTQGMSMAPQYPPAPVLNPYTQGMNMAPQAAAPPVYSPYAQGMNVPQQPSAPASYTQATNDGLHTPPPPPVLNPYHPTVNAGNPGIPMMPAAPPPGYTSPAPSPGNMQLPVDAPPQYAQQPDDSYSSSDGQGANQWMPDDSQQWNDPAPSAITTAASPTLTATPDSAGSGAASSTTVTPSLWTRFWQWLGFGAAATTATVHGEAFNLQDECASLVRRVNNGDQNAMALMASVRNNAAQGNPLAQRSLKMMLDYVGSNPEGGPTMGHEIARAVRPTRIVPRANDSWGKAVKLSHGEHLSNPMVGTLATHFGGEGDAFIFGVERPQLAARSEAQHYGKVVGMARKLQAVRMPNSKISDYSPTMGWEVGE